MRLPARRGRDDAGSDRADCGYKIPQSRAERPPFGRKGRFSAAGRTKSTLFKSAAGGIPSSVSVSCRRRIVRAHTKRSISPMKRTRQGGGTHRARPYKALSCLNAPFRRAALRKCRGTAAAAVPLKMFLSRRSRRPLLLKCAFASPPAAGYNGYNKELSLQRKNCSLTILAKY